MNTNASPKMFEDEFDKDASIIKLGQKTSWTKEQSQFSSMLLAEIETSLKKKHQKLQNNWPVHVYSLCIQLTLLCSDLVQSFNNNQSD
jgi:hypothetical protein